MILTLILYAVGAVSAPYVKVAEWLGGGPQLEWYLAFAFKTICSILPVYLMFQFGFKKPLPVPAAESKVFCFVSPRFWSRSTIFLFCRLFAEIWCLTAL